MEVTSRVPGPTNPYIAKQLAEVERKASMLKAMKARVERECHRRTSHLNKHIFTAWIARRWRERKFEIEVQLHKLKVMEEQTNREE